MVDLSKAKAGDTVKFNSGAFCVIKYIQTHGSAAMAVTFEHGKDEYDEDIIINNDGTVSGLPCLSITQVIPAPVAFDWSTVKWGQAFKHERHGGRILRYIAKDPCENCFLFSWLTAEELYKVYSPLSLSDLTRAPEHDVEVG